ncbi:MAG TPA: DUF4362 domain-containing protein [Clostridia bacterium]|nr:DUF4362 domain-containing protein [Clostridia bacterium]
MKKSLYFALCMLLFVTAGCASTGIPDDTAVLPTQRPTLTIAQTPEVLNTPAFMLELEDLPDPYVPEDAVKNGDYVDVHGNVSNANKLTEFYEAVDAKESAAIRITQYTIEGDAIIADVMFDGIIFHLTVDTTRDKFGAGEITEKEYSLIRTYETEAYRYVFLTDEGEITKELFESGFDGYLLLVDSVS